MEGMVIEKLFGSIYKGKRVFLTGHTGFKGSWLAFWLTEMGAIVKGYSLPPNTTPSHWDLLNLNIESVFADIRDKDRLEREVSVFNPDIVFHLAAQPLVRLSYTDPIGTYETNVMGTLNLLEVCRGCKSIKAIVNITTDKCYENKEWVYGYREVDPMGGYDPYSSSKGCVELMSSSYRNSYFNIKDYGITHNLLLATARAGNVIGGGDWAADRLVPDIVKSTVRSEAVEIRNPYATRPWQHVLEPLSGYLLLGQRLLEGNLEYAEGWNFGPDDEGNLNVLDVSEEMQKNWSNIQFKINSNVEQPHEAQLLKLDCSKAHSSLKWFPVWCAEDTLKQTVLWYKNFYQNSKLETIGNLTAFIKDAKLKNLIWTK
jgi:CDP-glucose 4,6-dehydratase